jgi:hypothetical protein
VKATLTVTYVDGTKEKVKLNAGFSAAHDESGSGSPFEHQPMPPMQLDKSSTKGAVFLVQHTTLNKDVSFFVDNFSVAYMP